MAWCVSMEGRGRGPQATPDAADADATGGATRNRQRHSGAETRRAQHTHTLTGTPRTRNARGKTQQSCTFPHPEDRERRGCWSGLYSFGNRSVHADAWHVSSSNTRARVVRRAIALGRNLGACRSSISHRQQPYQFPLPAFESPCCFDVPDIVFCRSTPCLLLPSFDVLRCLVLGSLVPALAPSCVVGGSRGDRAGRMGGCGAPNS